MVTNRPILDSHYDTCLKSQPVALRFASEGRGHLDGIISQFDHRKSKGCFSGSSSIRSCSLDDDSFQLDTPNRKPIDVSGFDANNDSFHGWLSTTADQMFPSIFSEEIGLSAFGLRADGQNTHCSSTGSQRIWNPDSVPAHSSGANADIIAMPGLEYAEVAVEAAQQLSVAQEQLLKCHFSWVGAPPSNAHVAFVIYHPLPSPKPTL